MSNHSRGSVSVINTIPATPTVSTISVGAQPFGLAISPDLSRVYVVNANDTVSIINTATNTVISTVTIDTQPENQWHSVAVSPDGRQIYVSDLADRTVRIVTIAPAPPQGNRAPVAGTPSVMTNGVSGTVTGSLNFTDPDGNSLTYSGTDSADKRDGHRECAVVTRSRRLRRPVMLPPRRRVRILRV